MKYFHALKGSALAFFIFVILATFLPQQRPIADIDLVLTVSTFLFAILAGFFIARLNSRYDRIVDYISDEDSYWISFYRSAHFMGAKFVNKIRDVIDGYYMLAFSSEVGNFYYKDTTPYLENVYKELYKLKLPDSSKAPEAFQCMVNFLSEIERTRNQSAVLTREKLTLGQWLVLILLAIIIIFCMLFLALPLFYSKVLTVLLSTILVLILLIIRDLQNLKLGGYALSIESGQEVLEAIGKPRYYPEFLIKDGTIEIPDSVKKYRLALGNGKIKVVGK